MEQAVRVVEPGWAAQVCGRRASDRDLRIEAALLEILEPGGDSAAWVLGASRGETIDRFRVEAAGFDREGRVREVGSFRVRLETDLRGEPVALRLEALPPDGAARPDRSPGRLTLRAVLCTASGDCRSSQAVGRGPRRSIEIDLRRGATGPADLP